MRSHWNLNPDEVAISSGTVRKGHRGKLSKSGRKVESRELELTLTHQPTGIKVSGAIQSGNYSRKELSKLKQELEARLFSDLEKKIAKFYKIPGQ